MKRVKLTLDKINEIGQSTPDRFAVVLGDGSDVFQIAGVVLIILAFSFASHHPLYCIINFLLGISLVLFGRK